MERLIIGIGSIFLILFTIILIFFRGGGQPTTPRTEKLKPLAQYATTSAQVSMTIDGRVNGEDVHRSIRVTVSQYLRTLDIIGGYSGNILTTQSFSNTQDAYGVFLRAINDAGFLARNSDYKIDDERGKCPLGLRQVFELNDAGDSLSRLWSSSCSNVGTLKGSRTSLQTLFKLQITDYNELTSGVRL